MGEEQTTRWIEGCAIGAVVIGAIAWVIVFRQAPTLEKAYLLGGAVGPIATLVTAAALFVGFNSLRLQREALRGQQKEIADTLHQMTRAAEAQVSLAAAQREATEVQRELLKAQKHANHRAAAMELAQRGTAIATLHGAYSALLVAQYKDGRGHWEVSIEPEKATIVTLVEEESKALEQLRQLVEKGLA